MSFFITLRANSVNKIHLNEKIAKKAMSWNIPVTNCVFVYT